MSELVHYEYPPPKSWEQFEELCADLFGTMWGDPGAVRNGRAGQTQNGVDIVAARGTVYPVGLQCKRKGRFPDKKLTRAEVVAEIAKADEFKPALKEFYILTTAAVDARLQEPVRLINAARRATGKFEVTILFWPDIVARVALLRDVAVKHFPLRGGDGGFSPLLATWYTKKGKLELTGVDWRLAVGELSEDFHVRPEGRVVVRQRETDEFVSRLKRMTAAMKTNETRQQVLELRGRLRRAEDRERRVQEMLHMLFKCASLKPLVMQDLDATDDGPSQIVRGVIESAMFPGVGIRFPEAICLMPPESLKAPWRSSPWLDPAVDRLKVYMPNNEIKKVVDREHEFRQQFNVPIERIVMELPPSVQKCFVIPAILGRVKNIMEDERRSLLEMEAAGYLDMLGWSYSR